jgi:hypothetical protein
MCTRGVHLSTQKWISPLWMLLDALEFAEIEHMLIKFRKNKNVWNLFFLNQINYRYKCALGGNIYMNDLFVVIYE